LGRVEQKAWVLGDKIVVERMYVNWKTERLSGLVAELVRNLVRWRLDAG